jgi:HD-GYP domain-containing protein (c-di-GMP phosphodiesterase class II)
MIVGPSSPAPVVAPTEEHLEASPTGPEAFGPPGSSGPTSDQLDLTQVCDALIAGWLQALNLHDRESEVHSRRVAEVSLRVATAMGLEGPDLVHLQRGTLLHDVGKLGIPESILNKPGPLDDAEWQLMRRHPAYAQEILAPLGFLGPALDVPYCHHERWDGLGYPRGLAGEQIPLPARICAAVDIWDALLSDRPYRNGWPATRVREHIASLAGNHLDPIVVENLLRATEEPVVDSGTSNLP